MSNLEFNPDSRVNYQIKNGDTLSKIAKEYGTTVKELAKLNGIKNVNLIFAGASLQIPITDDKAFNIKGASVEKSKAENAASQTNVELTAIQKKQIDEIRQLNYNSEELKTKLDSNKNINTYAKYLTQNANFKVSQTITAVDGGKIFIYVDNNGNEVGSIAVNPDGKVRNTAFVLADGGTISLNSDSDGTIESRYAMSSYSADSSLNETSLETALNTFIQTENPTKKVEQRENGVTAEYYYTGGEMSAFVLRDKSGKITYYDQVIKDAQGQQVRSYRDTNGNGKIDAGEGNVRFDLDLGA